MKSNKVNIGGITVQIDKKDNLKNMYVKVTPPYGDVIVSAPVMYPYSEIESFILDRIPRINNLIDNMLNQTRLTSREYVSGEAIYLWGKAYKLKVKDGYRKHTVRKEGGNIVLCVYDKENYDSKKRALNAWYRQELSRMLESMIPRAESITNVRADNYKIQAMKTKWGTCHPEKKTIIINLHLIKAPARCLEYILIHELTHLIEKNHTYRFNELLTDFCPNWENIKQSLQEVPLEY